MSSVLTVVALATTGSGVLLAQLEVIPSRMAFQLFLLGIPLGGLALGLELVRAFRAWPAFTATPWRWAVLGIGMLMTLGFARWIWRASTAPDLYDLTTSPDSPPRFWTEPQNPTYPPYTTCPPESAALQARFYPEVSPIHIPLYREQAFAVAVQTAEQLGWRTLFLKQAHGRFYAEAYSPVFRFRREIVVQVSIGENQGQAVNVRVRSPFGIWLSWYRLSDANDVADTIRTFAERLRHLAADHPRDPLL